MDQFTFEQSVSADLAAALARGPHPESILYGRLLKYDPYATYRAAYGSVWREAMEAHEIDRDVGLIEE